METSSIIYLFGAGQAALLLVGINLNEPLGSMVKKTISALLSAMIVLMLYYTVGLNKLENIYPYIDSLGTASWMALVPLYYFFCKSLYHPNFKLSWEESLLLVIPIVFLLEGLLTTLGFPLWVYLLVKDDQLYLDLWMIAFFLPGFYSLTKSILEHRKQNNTSKNKILIWFSSSFLTVLVVFAIVYLLLRENYVVWFELSLIIWCELFVFVLVFRLFKFKPIQKVFEISKNNNGELSTIELKKLANQLEKVMIEKKPFLNQKMTLSDLSLLSDVSSNFLSQLFNKHYESNFYEFVNGYRLAHLEGLLMDPVYQHYKIIALAEESGFNSKTTFYKAFREKHGVTPVEFIKKKKVLT